MKMLLITEDKLKVMLSRNDLDGYGIKIEDIDYDNTETRRVFWSILDDAKRETGFDAAVSRIFIQIYPDKTGGCDMYISRIKSVDGDPDGSRRGVACSIEKSSPGRHSEKQVYCFDRMEDLLAACRLLSPGGSTVEASAFASERGDGYYLVLDGCSKDLSAVAEYGRRCVGKYMVEHLREHGTVISDGNAISVLSRF